MGKFDKQLKYSIRKVSVGAASVVIGAFYLAMGAGVVHADTSSTSSNNDSSHSRPSPEPETSQPNGLTSSNYGAEPAQNPGVSGKSTESTTPKEKENNETLNATQPTEASTSANTRSRRVRRDTGDAPTGETSGNSTGTETPAGASTENNEALNSALTERKGSTVQPDQPGVNIPKGDESGAHDPNAHISFDDPGHNATVEEMWKIIQHMPDDFQNNERTYLRNMDTLGRELRFDKTAENPEGVPLQPGEIRELHDFGGWHAIDKDGTQGKFVIGRKNAQGYFTGWHKVGQTENGIPIIEQGGMLGADALDNIYVHEQALDRRFDYMLMLVKGRTRANRTETVVDNSTYDPRTPNERSNLSSTDFNNLHLLEKDKFNKYSPGVVGYNGIEKKFTAFSTKYGSRVRVDFVTGYITDINGSKGSYRVVIKAQNSKGEETNVYDETISRVAEIVQNEELYKKGLNVEAAHAYILKFLKGEFEYRVNKIKNPKVKANSLLRETKEKDYTPEQQKVYDQIVEEATEEAKKQGDIVMNVTEDFLSIAKSGKKDSEWKKTFTNTYRTTPGLSNELNNLLKNADKDNPNTPTWLSSGSSQAKADDRAYRLLTTLIPGAKKITYHVNDDQLEVETDKYTYTAARNGSKEVGIQGSDIAATLSADTYGANPQTFDRENTNTKANNLNHGWATVSSEEFKHFSRFIGVDKGIERTNVISDEELSAKIKEAVGPGYSKLGKPGYFSTADIPLGADIVSYTVQVIPSDNERVGVNSQSSRIQYNMPILADFSVIQDTTEPSKEVAKRILTKLKEQGKITEDQEKKIKEEIDKSKKTSEVRSAMSGDVTVRYVDTTGNNLPITEEDAKKAGEKTDNGYLVRKDVLIGTDYDVNSKKVSFFKATNGKYYALRSVGGGLETSSDAPNGSITKKNTVITFVYEERTTPPTGKGVVHFKKQTSETATEALTGYNDITLEGEVGKEFSTDEVNTKITELKNAGYEIVGDTFTNGNKTIDTIEDAEGQTPSQEYTITVKEKVETVTTPPTPNTPVDPNIPEGPKWPTEGLAKSDLEKEVTRTITYVKKETADGPEIADAKPTKKQTAHFKRSATYNLVTKVVTPGDWTSTDKTLEAVPTEKLDGYVANVPSVEEVETNANSTNLDRKVVYTKLGSWVPKVPGVETPTPLPYPNHPTDPTKPGDPTDPNTPNVPVIPYVPGYTPKIGETPLQPKVPNDPTQGYIPPAVPTEPGTNTDITYVADPQKAVVKVVKVEGEGEKQVKTPLENDTVFINNGSTDETIPTTDLNTKIADLEKRGYVVENKTLLENQKFDNKKDPETGDPTQVFELLVKERTVTVTEPKNPNDPVDPDKPEGPKWPTEGLAKSDLEKEVTRTITYVKKETADGPEIADAKPTKKQTAHFKRSATYNLVTKVVTPGEWTSTDKTLEAVPTEKLDGYVADKASVEKVETNADSTGLDQKVVYTKLGSWVPRLPEGVTPPTGTDMTPKPYPNNPTDPTKPGTPVYPEPGTPTDPSTPKPPVIPYVPGYTPKTPDGNPLVPVDPEHPENGYKVPPVPETPGTNTDIMYVADPQKAVVKVFNTTTGTEVEIPAEKVSIDNGTTDSAIPTKSLEDKIKDLEKRGYVVENKDLLNNQKFDKEKDPTDGDPTQVFKLLVKERTVTVTEPKNPNDPVDPDKPEGPKWPATGLAKSDLEKEVTRTITYVKKDTPNGEEIPDAKPTVTQTAHFKRSATYNAVTGTITYGNWESTDKELPKVDTPTLTGYVADKASVEKVETNADSTGLDQKVVYTKLGSWVPRLPEGVTPPTGTDMTPKPYPNDPTDPTTPGTPVYPEPGQPITPGTPVIPYVPGYTPKTPDGNPLVPVDPNHPENGYKVPPVPTTPGTNTDITYVADPQKAVVKVFNTTTGTEVELPAEKVSIDNGTTDSAIPTDSVTAKIADLEKRGYVVENKDLLNNQKFDKEKDPTDGDPTQVFKLLVKERTVTVTEPKNPNDPVDPDKPEGPKWPETGLKESDLKKEVTRTITYVKKDTPNGEEIPDAKPTVTQTAHFKRSATYNLVTKVVTPGEWTSTDNTLAEVPTEKLDGYVANVPSVEEVETNANSTNLDRKVVYTKLGSWVPKVPGVETPTPLPYPNHPTDPTKPGDPTDPNTPNVPVIPYVPGYTPSVGGTPLVPKVPNDPTQGYIPPAVPTEPGTNTDITYVADPQKAVVKVFNTTTGTEVEIPAEKVSIDNGTTDSAIPTDSVTAKIADLEKRGYVVENKDLLKDQKFDKEKDPTDGDPTQVFKLLVKERTVTVTEPKNPNDPVDPDKPEGPKWPATGLAKSDLEKEVTRTITYVKKDTPNGEEIPDAKPTVTQTAHFKRSATYNAVTGTITYGNWESADKELAKVDTPTLTGYVADKASVEKVETNADSTGLDQKVVYTKLGSWVPKVPGVETPTPLPYPNHPTDPTKPGTPTDPSTPKPPVIPYVPGYTPKTPDGNPLVPVDPEHPENGYKVPPVPTIPGQDTPITYVKDGQQKAITSFVDPKGNVLETPITETGDSNTPLTKNGEVEATIAKLKLKGYDVETNTYPPTGTFDNDPKVDQYFKVTLTPRVKPVKPFDPTNPKDPNKPVPGQPIDPDTPVDPNNPNDPTIPRWTEDLINKLETTKQVTRTINYVDEEGNKISKPSTDKVTFTREAKINVVTGEITYGDWNAVGGDSTFDKVSSPVVKGFILKDPAQKEVAERKGITPTVANQTIEVVYKKLGSWLPKVPGVETPTPLPYPNDPTDPTKPGDPTDPNTPNVPVIPYVPGYTPKTPDGNPLVPVDPNDPTKGYIPPVPTKPGEDTPIEYVKVPNTPSPEDPVKPTPESNHITIWVDENGKPLKPEKPGTHEPGNIPGYRYITTVTKDGVTIHKFEKITPVEPNNPVPQKPTTPLPTPQDPTIPTPESQIPTPNTPEANTPTSETNRREELPNTGTEANASLASAGIMTLLAGLGLGFFKKKEEDESE